MNRISPRIWGAIGGVIVSILILWPHVGWKLLVVAIIVLIGYTVGYYFESGREVREKFKEFISLLFR
jgi:uncharacterized membrane protein